jgi:hypothetical protein
MSRLLYVFMACCEGQPHFSGVSGGLYEHRIEPTSYVKDRKFLMSQSDCQFINLRLCCLVLATLREMNLPSYISSCKKAVLFLNQGMKRKVFCINF